MKTFCMTILAGVFCSGCGTVFYPNPNTYWQPPVLSKEGCPDLSGRYWVESTRASLLLSGNDGYPYHKNKTQQKQMSEEYAPLPEAEWVNLRDNVRWIYSIENQTNTIVVSGRNWYGNLRYTIDLTHPMNGCRDGAFVSRYAVAYGGGETSVQIRFIEVESKKLPDGSLQRIGRGSRAEMGYFSGLSSLNGMPPPTVTVDIFPPAE